ncbi:MAG: thiamine pyrophosphate-dependent enzyme [Candidatus Brocadiales bacterium]|nr:thiamine pyrophosphate-dependent enzyme [Candidatus Brocadiales bacterium]
MKLVFDRPKSMKDANMHYCPGCSHGVINRIVAEAIDVLDLRERTVCVAPVGCAVFLYDYMNFDVTEAPHGRPPAVATGIKRARPDLFVFTYQGDGDIAAIGLAEILSAANRGENFSVIYVNNTVYGMTGGQMAPTTLLGQRTTTTPYGRDAREGHPMRMAEWIASMEGPSYSVRVAVNNPANIVKTKKAVLEAFKMQLEGRGLSFVEILATCPISWGLTPVESLNRVEKELIPYYPLGVFKSVDTSKKG